MADFGYEYEKLLRGTFQKYLVLSEKIGGAVAEQSKMVKDAFGAQVKFVLLAENHNKPKSDTDLQVLLKPMSDKISEIMSHREKHRSSEYFHHLSVVSESSQILAWVVVPEPAKYAKELHSTAAYYGNKVITAYKNKEPLHADWAKTYLDVLSEICDYVKEYHRFGLQWNVKAPSATAGDASMTPVKGTGDIPTPPPPPPPEIFDSKSTSSSGSGDPHAALFREINQGSDITKCLKKVDKLTIKDKPAAGGHSAKSPKAPAAVVKPPKFSLEGRKWCIENQKGVQLTVSNVAMNQSVSIYKCEDTVITVDGKVNCITMDSCKKTSVVFNDIVAFVEFINCQSVKGQSLGTLPTLTIDNTDGIQMFLNEKSTSAEVITSKSSEINLNIPVPNEYDYLELSVPEQLRTTISGGHLLTTIIEKK